MKCQRAVSHDLRETGVLRAHVLLLLLRQISERPAASLLRFREACSRPTTALRNSGVSELRTEFHDEMSRGEMLIRAIIRR